jgi:hypothetical protein
MDPDAAETRALLEELIAKWEVPDEEISVEPRGLSATTGIIVFCLTSHTYTLARGVLALYDADLALAAVPLVRQMIECAVTAMWTELASEPGARVLLREQSRTLRTAVQDFVRAGMPADNRLGDEDDTTLLGSGATAAAAKHFQQLCGELEVGDRAYATYRAASQVSHASMTLADQYLDADIEDIASTEVRVSKRPFEYNPHGWLRYALLMTIHATSAWSRIETSRRHEATMRELHERFGTSFETRFTQMGAAKQAQREREHRDWLAAALAAQEP